MLKCLRNAQAELSSIENRLYCLVGEDLSFWRRTILEAEADALRVFIRDVQGALR
jgi:hypothetical protein